MQMQIGIVMKSVRKIAVAS